MLHPWNLPIELPMNQPDANADDPSRGRKPATSPLPESFAPDRQVIEGGSTELADETRNLLHRRLRAASRYKRASGPTISLSDLTRADVAAPTFGASELEAASEPGTSGGIELSLSLGEDETGPER